MRLSGATVSGQQTTQTRFVPYRSVCGEEFGKQKKRCYALSLLLLRRQQLLLAVSFLLLALARTTTETRHYAAVAPSDDDDFCSFSP
jgi:hypothetical protein